MLQLNLLELAFQVFSLNFVYFYFERKSKFLTQILFIRNKFSICISKE